MDNFINAHIGLVREHTWQNLILTKTRSLYELHEYNKALEVLEKEFPEAETDKDSDVLAVKAAILYGLKKPLAALNALKNVNPQSSTYIEIMEKLNSIN
jgi:hypothetical protein